MSSNPEQHDYVKCENPVCLVTGKSPDHCKDCGSPRDHPSHTCYVYPEQSRGKGAEPTTQEGFKAQYWNGSQDGEVGEWSDVEDSPKFASEGEGSQWEFDNQEYFYRTSTRIVPVGLQGDEAKAQTHPSSPEVASKMIADSRWWCDSCGAWFTVDHIVGGPNFCTGCGGTKITQPDGRERDGMQSTLLGRAITSSLLALRAAPIASVGGEDTDDIDIERELRMELWLNHGHLGIYGDDGEMQCGQCAPMWDYKREPIAAIIAQARRARMQRAEGIMLNARLESAPTAAEPVQAPHFDQPCPLCGQSRGGHLVTEVGHEFAEPVLGEREFPPDAWTQQAMVRGQQLYATDLVERPLTSSRPIQNRLVWVYRRLATREIQLREALAMQAKYAEMMDRMEAAMQEAVADMIIAIDHAGQWGGGPTLAIMKLRAGEAKLQVVLAACRGMGLGK